MAPPFTLTLLRVEPQLADHLEALRGEGFVQLDEVELVDADAGAVEQLADGRDGADAHHARVDARDGAADEAPERLAAELAGLVRAGDDEGRGAVVDPARVARR